MTRVLALDYGSARCGCAISDPSGTLATPLDVVTEPASRDGLKAIAALVDELRADEVVVGMPVSLSGVEGSQAAETRVFRDRLSELIKVPVRTYDERFTTQMAERTPGRAPEDSRAAAHLLTSYLDARVRP